MGLEPDLWVAGFDGWCAWGALCGLDLVVVVVVDEVVVGAATEVPVCPAETVDGVLLDDPQPAASRAAPSTPNAAPLYLVISISIPQDACVDQFFPRSILALVHLGQLTPPEQRVLGALIEKRWTTPDQYPLSLNSLRLACNQLTNRDPVTQYDDATVREAAQRLSRYGVTRLASGHGSRSVKYRHLAEEALSLGREELAVLAVLLLRGPQTPGEIKARTERMATFGSLADVERVLEALSEKGHARRLGRRPGQKEDRFEQLLGGEGEPASVGSAAGAAPGGAQAHADVPAPTAGPDDVIGSADGEVSPRTVESAAGNLEARVALLETEVADLRQQVADLLRRP